MEKRILVFSNGEKIGDGIIKLPLLYEIKKTNCEILALEHDDPKDYKDYVSQSLNFLSNI